jgi:hypothetical protein
VLQG